MYARYRTAASFLFATLLILLAGCSTSTPSNGAGAPKAAIIADNYLTYPGYPILFSGLGSSDPQNETLSYAWNFGDGSTGTGAQVLKGYAQAGSYTVSLKVTNTSGQSNSTSITIKIVLPGTVPTANAGGPYSGAIGAPITFNGSGSSDPQGQALTYAWTFGDGGSATGVSPTHTYTQPGGYSVTLVVTNASGIPASATSTASIAYPSPTVTINGPYSGKPTLAIAFTSTVSEPYDASFTYQWNFGDGSYASVANPTHTYAAAGTYVVTLTVTGQYRETATVTSSATITAQASTGSFSGTVQSGATPISGAHVHLFAANTTGYGQASVSLLSNTGLTDSAGSYVLSSATGAFTIPSGLTCGTHQQLYLYATGGTAGAYTNITTGLLAALGACGGITNTTLVTIDEATTIAAAYALSGYATAPASVSSPSTTAAQTGIANAFLNAANLASLASGQAVANTTNGVAPQTTVNTLANILNACVSSATGSSACTGLFAATQATDTASAALAIAHAQGANVAALYALQSAASAPFTPHLTAAPNDLTLGVNFNGLLGYGTSGLAIDGNGNVWVLQYPQNYKSVPYLTQFSSNGVLQQGFDTTCNALNVATPNAIAIDPSNNVFLLTTSGGTYYDVNDNEQSYSTAQYCTLNPSGVMISPPGGYNLGGSESQSLSLYNLAIGGDGTAYIPSTTLLGRTLNGGATNGQGYIAGNAPYIFSDAIDGSGDHWVTSPATNGIVKLSSTGTLLSPPNGFIGGGLSVPASLAIDHTGNVWAINSEANYPNAGTSLSKLSPTGAPFSGSGITSGPPVPYSIAIDGASNVWAATGYNISGAPLSVYELSPAGATMLAISHANQSREYLNDPQSIAVDSTGSVWVSNGLQYTVTQFIGAATPVVTPLAANLQAPYNNPASKP
ncbi:PKD repeat-containing protein [Granulicella rosea]|uniref:PKD repeat-containing protein n=1 Tax=Granulicella rosea TaxID=474952 RepID=A0A239EQJ7_9BACT|nr:PKD domain-containing protein [Granulicella rosea]SNS46681.1 PKD repeat-containing protein [Granulicella rosea]